MLSKQEIFTQEKQCGKKLFDLRREFNNRLALSKIQNESLFLNGGGDSSSNIASRTRSKTGVLSKVKYDILPSSLYDREDVEYIPDSSSDEESFDELKGGSSEAKKNKQTSRSERAGLQFPVGRVSRYLRHQTRSRLAANAPVYLAAVLEYITAEILELSANAAKDNKRSRIIPRHIQLAMRNDEELNKLFKGNIASGGVLPNIHAALLPKHKYKEESYVELEGGAKGGKKAAKKIKSNKKRRKGKESWKIYIYKVLKQVSPDMGMSGKGMNTLDSLVDDLFERIADEANKVVRYAKTNTLDSRAIQTGVRVVIPGELCKHAVSEGAKAVTKFTSKA